MTLRRCWSLYGGYAIGFASLFALWHVASVYLVGSVLFPPPAVVFKKGWVLARNGVLWEHLSASVQRMTKLTFDVELSDFTMGLFRLAESQLKQQGKLAKPVDYGTFVYPDLLRKVQPGKVTYKP